jgi:hypothetical protein
MGSPRAACAHRTVGDGRWRIQRYTAPSGLASPAVRVVNTERGYFLSECRRRWRNAAAASSLPVDAVDAIDLAEAQLRRRRFALCGRSLRFFLWMLMLASLSQPITATVVLCMGFRLALSRRSMSACADTPTSCLTMTKSRPP